MAHRRSQRLRAVVLDRTKLKEQDLILTLLALNGTQVRAVAKGARKPGSRLAARTELCCDVDVLVSQGRGLGIVTEAQIVDAHTGVRTDLERLSCAAAMLEVARLTCYEEVEDPFLHPLLSRALRSCEQAHDRAHLDVAYAAYVLKVLSHCGWRPVLDACVACGEPTFARFSVAAGGVICESCARDVAGAEPVGAGHVAWLAALIGCTFDTLLASEVDRHVATFVLETARSWASTHLDARLRAAEFFAGA